MAYMDQDKKSKIAAALKQVVPAGWKYSLAVRHHSTIVMTIASAPVDLIEKLYGAENMQDKDRYYAGVNPHWAKQNLKECDEKEVMLKVLDCLNIDNFDESDIMSDYFHVGHYVDIKIGTWQKPFVVTEQIKKAA
jgi:hypothetical protein